MSRIWWVGFLLLLSGCSGGMRSSLVEMDMRVASPMLGLNDELPVVYPYRARGVSGDPMMGSFGATWQSLEPVYTDYRFNP